MRPRPTVSLLTDFGDADGYVGALRGIIRSLAPEAEVIDLAHHIPPGDVTAAAFVLATTAPYFPDGCIHVAVVDPGVGTDRRAVAVTGPRHTFVAPDNGILTGILPPRPSGAWRAVEIREPGCRRKTVSATFHGRDVFAPAAAHLAAGADLAALGPALDPRGLERIAGYRPVRRHGQIAGRVLAIDRFGNLRTNVPAAWLGRCPVVVVDGAAGRTVLRGLVRTFGDVEPGSALAYVGSAGTLEIAVRGASAAERLAAGAGAPVTVTA